ncbi:MULTISPECIES: helix-turn-helix domain-containing protein [unclassified Lysinibacillus]|uniref:helix-turn-helix domain-containing protein n=1 Tax=unclassified Lysinibacillus TaxID=2636778 RepID=UPI0037FC7E5D
METKYVEAVISNDELAKLIAMAKSGDKAAMTNIIDMYREDIQNSSKYIKMNKEHAFQSIITDFIELLTKDDKDLESHNKRGLYLWKE